MSIFCAEGGDILRGVPIFLPPTSYLSLSIKQTAHRLSRLGMTPMVPLKDPLGLQLSRAKDFPTSSWLDSQFLMFAIGRLFTLPRLNSVCFLACLSFPVISI